MSIILGEVEVGNSLKLAFAFPKSCTRATKSVSDIRCGTTVAGKVTVP